MDRSGKNWQRDESIVAFNLYCKTPFGRIHNTNPDVIRIAEKIGRSASALEMKMLNFAHFDPELRNRNVSGLAHVGKTDKQIWDEFNEDWEKLAVESEEALARLEGESAESAMETEITGPTAKEQVVKTRLVQRFFRASVLSSYNFACCFCGLGVAGLLNASHIVPWAVREQGRADPRNGLCLCALHDRAFDRGMMAVDEELRIILAGGLKRQKGCKVLDVAFVELEGVSISPPERFLPEAKALAYHRENIFEG